MRSTAIHVIKESNLGRGILTGGSNGCEIRLRHSVHCIVVTDTHKCLGRGFRLGAKPRRGGRACVISFFLSPVDGPIIVRGVFCSFSGTALHPRSGGTLSRVVGVLGSGPGIAVRLKTRASQGNSRRCGRQLTRQQTRSIISCLVTKKVTRSQLRTGKCNRDIPGTVGGEVTGGCSFLGRKSILARRFVREVAPRRRRVTSRVGHQARFGILQAGCGLF